VQQKGWLNTESLHPSGDEIKNQGIFNTVLHYLVKFTNLVKPITTHESENIHFGQDGRSLSVQEDTHFSNKVSNHHARHNSQ
jgi:hypothetical protein